MSVAAQVEDAPTTCFHCGELLVTGKILWMPIRGRNVAVCCEGCRAAATLVAGLGLEDFYRFRSAVSARPETTNEEWTAYDRDDVLASVTRAEGDKRSIVLLIDGSTCAACSWLVSQALLRHAGVNSASVNAATGRAQLTWDPNVIKLSRLLGVINELGFRPHLITGGAVEQQAQRERRSLLKRLAMAGLGMMQVMMFAVALYAGDFQGMEVSIRDYLRVVSLFVTTPVLLYAGAPFFASAYNALRAKSINMDVPVSLGLTLAFAASIVNTLRHAGEVYFDSVVMFIFFLTVARYVEMIARHTNTSVTDSLSRLLPAIAHRVRGQQHEEVPVAELIAGDRLVVRTGDVVPADAVVIDGETRLDESMLTGEPLPVRRAKGQRVTAGTLNVDAPIVVEVVAVGARTVLAGIVALLNRAQAERPKITREADRTASHFLWRVLIGAVVVAVTWSLVDPARAFPATLAVLVVACPCALSLATLVVVASATSALAKRGMLVANADAIEGLAKVSHVVFDKTGTLTTGRLRIKDCEPAPGRAIAECMDIAAALEAHSEHPIARAFVTDRSTSRSASDVRVTAGKGIEGTIDGVRYRAGTPAFATELSGGALATLEDTNILLADASGVVCKFQLADTVRPEAPIVVSELKSLGLGIRILSGDASKAVARVAHECGIDTYAARQSPEDKLEHVRGLTRADKYVAVVGDGINDAPVLGGAGVAIAMSHGSPLAMASADIILLNDSLAVLPQAFALAKRAKTVMKQNLAWATAYNLSAMPFAALGWIPPWLAAIGMSLSSILVVLNALRIAHEPTEKRGIAIRAHGRAWTQKPQVVHS